MHPVLAVGVRETTRYLDLLDRRSLLALVAVGIVLGSLWPAISQGGVDPQEGLYRVAVEEDSRFGPVVAQDPLFIVQNASPANRQRADIVLGDEVHYDPASQASRAAVARLSTSTQQYMDRVMQTEGDEAAAFPVRVNLQFVPRTLDQASSTQNGAPGPGGGQPPADGSGAPGENRSSPNATSPSTQVEQAETLPSQIDPPFPLRSLLLTFAYLIPLTFVGDLVGGSVFSERIRSRGTALLASPVGSAGLLAGKLSPYVLATVGLAAVMTVILGAGWIGFAASLPILAFALVTAVVIGILAPSQRSLTFMLVSVNVLLSTFLFLPALFTEIRPVAYLSPVGLIAGSIRGEALTLGHLAYATVPLWLITGTLTLLAVAMYREETLMAPGGALPKLVDGLSHLVTRKRHLVVAGGLAVPLALVLELFVLVFAVTLDVQLALVAFLIGGALVEELLKAAPAYASYAREGASNAWSPLTVGALVGLGFFLVEKGTVGLALFGFGNLPGGDPALATFGIASSVLLLAAPLVLHVVTASMTAWAASEGRREAVVGWLGAGLVHAAYNGAVLLLAGGGIPS